eukprot:comp18076_c0_seq1/m.18683 comp18076_c0_seq1/g.18683  ORF comp18076_c0_seq1/g.18683 comp18076_c0_seq1/m.18683 type:complete len:188 (-) comp18076_c0_seq1:339-902(-)
MAKPNNRPSAAKQSESSASTKAVSSKSVPSKKGKNVWGRLKETPLVGKTLPALPLIAAVVVVTVLYPLMNKLLLWAYSNVFLKDNDTPPTTIFHALKGDGGFVNYFLIFSTFYTLNSVVVFATCMVSFLVGFDAETVLAFSSATLDYTRMDNELGLLERSLVGMRSFLRLRLFVAFGFTYFVYSGNF